jgi:predicted metalloprotease
MRPLRTTSFARGALAALLSIGILSTPASARASTPQPKLLATTASADVEVSNAQIAASNAKVSSAFQALVEMWHGRFARLGAEFVPPSLLAYRGPVRTGCGIMSADNAAYCAARNTIYFDEVFLARLAGAAAEQLGTDGDMAAIGVIAHEMGHAVVSQLGADSRVPYENEAAADCLAGAFTEESDRGGALEPGDLEEAFFGLAAAGDPTPQLTGDRRLDRRIVLRASLMGHGTREQRLSNFRAGYERGAGACVNALRR